MTAPLRLSPLAPPPVPSFVKARPGTLPGSVARGGESPGFSLDLANVQHVREARQETSSVIDGLAEALVENLQHSDTQTVGLTAAQKADLAFHLMLQIRNKLMDAYREIQQIQI